MPTSERGDAMFDGLFDYTVGPFAGQCHLTVTEGERTIVLASEINEGRTVTNAVEAIATKAIQTFQIDPQQVLFIQHVPQEGYFEVHFHWELGPDGRPVATAPEWEPFTNLRLLGQVEDHGVDQTRAKIWADVQKYGFSVLGVVGDQSGPHFTYTIGLYPTIMPELIMFGIRPDGATTLFHQIVKKRKDEGMIFESGKTYEGISEKYPLYFHQVDREHYHRYVLAAIRWHNETREFPLYQVVWPDTASRFPWQANFEERFTKDQPLLFRAPSQS